MKEHIELIQTTLDTMEIALANDLVRFINNKNHEAVYRIHEAQNALENVRFAVGRLDMYTVRQDASVCPRCRRKVGP